MIMMAVTTSDPITKVLLRFRSAEIACINVATKAVNDDATNAR